MSTKKKQTKKPPSLERIVGKVIDEEMDAYLDDQIPYILDEVVADPDFRRAILALVKTRIK